jgi:hypothetical protein
MKKIIKKLRWLICKGLIYERECRPREFEGCFPIKIIKDGKVVDEFYADYMTIRGNDTIELNVKEA